MTTVNFDLSTTLQNTLGAATDATVYVYAFGASVLNGPVSLVTSATLYSGGAIGATSIDLPAGSFFSGDIYVVIQQGQTTMPTVASPSDIIGNASAYNYSYQLFEATLGDSQYDLGDISAVNTFGFTSTYEVVYQDGTDTRGFLVSGETIFDALPSAAVADYDPNTFPNPQQLATGPATANNAAPWDSSVWQTYVDNLKNDPTTLADIQIVYAFQGSSIDDKPILSQYGVQYVANDQYGTDYFWLVPDTSYGAKNTDWIQIQASALVDNIYVQGGSITVYAGGPSGTATPYNSFTPDNADGGVVKHFVAGFDAGFWGGTGTSPNALSTSTLDFNKGYNWNVNYAYDAILLNGVGSASYTNSLGTQSSSDFFYDPWAQQFVGNSNAYGYSYSDLVSTGGVNPQISLWDPSTSANVETINITLYDTGETPSGYKASSQGYIAPGAGGYEAATTQNTNNVGFDFNFSVGSGPGSTYAPADDTPIILKIYAPGAAGADGDGFIVLNLSSDAGTGDWWYYSIEQDPTHTWTFDVSNPTDQPGFFNIFNLPGTSDGTAAWYQLVFGEGPAQSTYNIYAETDVGGGITNLVVDHGIEVTYNSAIDAWTLDFAPGGHMFYDIRTFAGLASPDPDAQGVTVIGSKKADFVSALYSVGTQQTPTGAADVIDGRDGHDQLSGLGGNDTINGGKGMDFLRGNDGDDILQVKGSEGIRDMFDGGSGNDTLQFLGNGAVTLEGFVAAQSSIEVLQGNGRGLFGTGGMNVFDLSGLTAMTNLRFIDAKGGNDRLIGSDFADELRGAGGDDILDGRGGNDILNGGGGLNTYVFGDGYGADTVVKFNAGKDKFDFTGVTGVGSFGDLDMTEIAPKTVQIDFGSGDTLTIHKTTIAILTANPGDFLFS
jgi:hypothetical protein